MNSNVNKKPDKTELITAMCWHCSHEYERNAPACPKCGKANWHINITLATWQMTEPPN